MQRSLRPFARYNLSKTIWIFITLAAILLLFGRIVFSAAKILFGACLIAFLVSPLAKLLEKKFRRNTACLLSMLLSVLTLLGLFAVLLPILMRQIGGILDLLPEAFSRLRATFSRFLQNFQNRFPDITLPQADFSALEGNFSGIARHTIDTAGSLAGSAYQLILSVILAFFLLSDRDKALLRAELCIPSPWRTLAVRMGTALLRQFRLYIRGQMTIALLVALLAGAALTLIGVKAAPLLGLIVGLFNVIPYFGPFIGGIPAFIMALSVSWQKAAFTVLALFLVQQVDSLVLSPRVMGSVTGFSPGVVLLAVFLGQQAFSIAGMLLAMPLLMAARTVYRVFVQRHENN